MKLKECSLFQIQTLSGPSAPSHSPEWSCFQSSGLGIILVSRWLYAFGIEVTSLNYVIQGKEHCAGSLWPLQRCATALPLDHCSHESPQTTLNQGPKPATWTQNEHRILRGLHQCPGQKSLWVSSPELTSSHHPQVHITHSG